LAQVYDVRIRTVYLFDQEVKPGEMKHQCLEQTTVHHVVTDDTFSLATGTDHLTECAKDLAKAAITSQHSDTKTHNLSFVFQEAAGAALVMNGVADLKAQAAQA
jgi:hypothetical protein